MRRLLLLALVLVACHSCGGAPDAGQADAGPDAGSWVIHDQLPHDFNLRGQ